MKEWDLQGNYLTSCTYDSMSKWHGLRYLSTIDGNGECEMHGYWC